MAVETNQSRIITEYEAIRRRQYTLITDMLEVLPRIDNLHSSAISEARDALFHADHPFLMVFVGPFSSGKSSLINALLGTRDLLEVGPVPTTDRISILRWGDEPQRMESGGDVDTVFYPAEMLKKVSLVDTPGLESVFQRHEETTRKFLHRCDVVMLVMLATQAMTSSNLEYLQKLRDYGKKIFILINQADLLSEKERETVRDYVVDQSMTRLGFKPRVLLVSARQGLKANEGVVRNADLWHESGLEAVEKYVETQLGDIERLRQKLLTPLQIAQNVNASALRALRTNQATFDQYQKIRENIDQQLASQKSEQEKTIREINQEIRDRFSEAAERGGEAIREVFRFSQAFRSIGRGIGEMTGLARLFRKTHLPPYIKTALIRHKAFEPIDQLPIIVDRLAPRLEGRDLHDTDDLVKYTQREISQLPASMKEKIIGTVQAPVQYDRRHLQEIRPDLERLEEEARGIEVDKITATARNTVIYVALWEILIVIFGTAFLLSGIGVGNPQLMVIVLLLLIGAATAGLVFLPLAGHRIQNQYTRRLKKIEARYIEILGKAADRQLEYGLRLRLDVVAPLTRLIEAQGNIQNAQLARLVAAEQEMTKIETELNRLGKRNLLGIGS